MPKIVRQAAPAQEPRWTLYPEEWRAAREQVALLPSARQRRLFWALLEHIERGWKIILPLQVAADRIAHGRSLHRSTAEDVAAFIESDSTDVYRGLAHAGMYAVPGMSRAPREGGLGIVADDAGDVARYLRILALGTHHPEFPPDLCDIVRTTAVEMTGWEAGLADVLEPWRTTCNAPGTSFKSSTERRLWPACGGTRRVRYAAASAVLRMPLRSWSWSRNE